MTDDVAVTAPSPPGRETREQRAWYFYDWANSAYVTTTATVLMAPYLTSVATAAACPGLAESDRCTQTLSVLGVPIAPGSLFAYTATVSTLVSVLVLIVVGSIADRSRRPTQMLAGFAWLGAVAAAAMFFVAGTNWQLGVLLLVVANLALGSSLVIYDSLLVRIAVPDDRDRVSSKGWGFGYLGGGILLALNFGLDLFHTQLGLDRALSTRISLLSAGVWWGLFTLIPVLGLRHVGGTLAPPVERSRGAVRGSFVQLADTFRELRLFPQTMLFLLAYLFFNDGIQTVIGNSSLYGIEELKFSQSTVLGVFLFVQFVAFGGSILFGRVAAPDRRVAHRPVQPRRVDGDRRRGVLRPGQEPRAVRRSGAGHRAGPRRQPGAVPFALQPAHPPRPGGRVLRPLPGDGARDELVRDVDLRAGLPVHALLPVGDHRARRVLPRRRRAAVAGPDAGGHRGRRQRGSGGHLNPLNRRPPRVVFLLVIPVTNRSRFPEREAIPEQRIRTRRWNRMSRRRSHGTGAARRDLRRDIEMADRTLRGTRLSTFSFESETNVVPSERRITTYVCPQGHRIELPFSVEADVPPVWECRCGNEAKLLDGPEPTPKETKHVRTHWDMLLERRSIPELEELLEERLTLLRESRGEKPTSKRSA